MPVIIPDLGEYMEKWKKTCWEFRKTGIGRLVVNIISRWLQFTGLLIICSWDRYLLSFAKLNPRTSFFTFCFCFGGLKAQLWSIFFPKLVDPLIQWFLFVRIYARDCWWQPKKISFVVVGRKTLVLYPEAKNFYVVYGWTALQQNASGIQRRLLSPKQFWFRNSFLWIWQDHLASILISIS